VNQRVYFIDSKHVADVDSDYLSALCNGACAVKYIEIALVFVAHTYTSNSVASFI
jgi:hypothetical protein